MYIIMKGGQEVGRTNSSLVAELYMEDGFEVITL